jgi:PKD repeat protein
MIVGRSVKEDCSMSEDSSVAIADKPADTQPKGLIARWLKTAFGTLAGLLSGAFVMYLSPLLDKVIKPAKPIANFAVESKGTTVTFYNHSSGTGDGWFDFGDGSPLEPVSPKQPIITHTYPKADSYFVKLTWRNLLGDENDRTVKIELDAPKSEPPAILSLEAIPLTPGAFAPATFRLIGKTKNAKLCVWDCGDERNLEFSTESPDNQDRLVTFAKAGGYVVKLAAVNGEQAAEKTLVVNVDEPPAHCCTVVVNVLDQGTRVDRVEKAIPVTANFPPHARENTYHFERQVPAWRGFTIMDAKLVMVNEQGSRNVEAKIAADRQSVLVTGDLVKETSLFNRNAPPPAVVMQVVLTQERRTAAKRTAVPVTGTLSVPGSLLVALPGFPPNWTDPQRKLQVELRDCDKVVWQGSQLPQGAVVAVQNHACALTATPQANQIRIDLTEVKTAGPAAAK